MGANLRVAVRDRMSLVVNMEYGKADGGETQAAAMLELELTF